MHGGKWWAKGVLLLALFSSIAYLGRVYVAMLRPAAPPTVTRRPSGTPTPSPTSTRWPSPTPTGTPSPLSVDGERAYKHVVAQVAFGPRVPGSEASRLTRQYIRGTLERDGWVVVEDRFTYRGVTLVNVIAQRGTGPSLSLAAHYDSRARADRDPDPERRNEPVPGANDGASGVAALLELSHVLAHNVPQGTFRLYFFDGEDQGGLNGWPWAVGARHEAQKVQPGEVQTLVLLDMVGDKEQTFYWEGNSDEHVRMSLWDVAAELGYESVFIPRVKYTVVDDHVPFVERDIPAVDIIDLDYPYWHTVSDTVDRVSPESLARVAQVVYTWIVREHTRARRP